MIQRTSPGLEARSNVEAVSPANWKTLMAGAVRSPRDLLERLSLDPSVWLQGAEQGHRLFPVFVPEPYLAKIRPGDPDDPLLRQVLPLDAERHPHPRFVADPLQESASTSTPGLIRKYHSRALLVLTGACAINCRYCFRRQFPYADHRLDAGHRRQALDFLREDPAINEVIFSGGDPLVMNDASLGQLVKDLAAIPHIRRLRIHSRLPVVIPQRITDEMLAWLSGTRLQRVVVLHINHPAEIDAQVREAAQAIRATGATVLNQSVLLKGVNADTDTLCALSEALFSAGILPYYLHCLDPVAGAAHFHTDDAVARQLVRSMLERLPGFLVPRLVREVPGKPSKTPLDLHLT